MAKVEIIRDYKKMHSGLKDKETGMIIIPCNYNLNEFTMVTDIEGLILDIYLLKNKNFNKDINLGLYFKNGNYLMNIKDCLLTLYHYLDFNVLFTHAYNSKEFDGAIIFDNSGKFIAYKRISNIVLYTKSMIEELGILTDKDRVYLVDGTFYEFDMTKYPLGSNKDYPFRRLKDRVMGKVESEYGERMIDADSIEEFDYKLENGEEIMQTMYENSPYLQEKYPEVKEKVKKLI